MCAFSLWSTYNTFVYFVCGRMHSTAQSIAQNKPNQPNRYTRLFFSVIVIFVCCFYLMWIVFFPLFFFPRCVSFPFWHQHHHHRNRWCVYMRSVLASFFPSLELFLFCFVIFFLLWFVWTLRRRDGLHILVSYARCMRTECVSTDVGQGENE